MELLKHLDTYAIFLFHLTLALASIALLMYLSLKLIDFILRQVLLAKGLTSDFLAFMQFRWRQRQLKKK
jgi:hypothetical protein